MRAKYCLGLIHCTPVALKVPYNISSDAGVQGNHVGSDISGALQLSLRLNHIQDVRMLLFTMCVWDGLVWVSQALSDKSDCSHIWSFDLFCSVDNPRCGQGNK